MRIVYIASQYPSLTETFVAREIEQVIEVGHEVTICILRPFQAETAGKAIRVKGAGELRVSPNILNLLTGIVLALKRNPKAFVCCFKEAMGSVIRKPRRSLHIVYIFFAVTWFFSKKAISTTDYIHCHFLHTEAIASRWLSTFLDVPYGLTAHIVRIRFDHDLFSKIVHDATICIGDTKETVSLLRQLGNSDPVLLRNGINIEQFEYKLPELIRSKGEVPVILAVGSLLPLKGFHIFVKACALLHQMKIPFLCRIVGEGRARSELESLARALQIEEKLELPGAMPIAALIEQYKQATIFVMPSIPSFEGTDGLPTVMIEAMAIGIPVIGTSHAAIPDLIRHGETGLLVPPEDPEALAVAIQQLFKDRELYQKLSRNGRRLVETEFSLRQNASLLIRMITNLTNMNNVDIQGDHQQ